MFSSDDECKVKNKKILVKNTTQLIYCQNIILCSPREFHSVCKPVGIRTDFLSTKKKKNQFPRVVQMAMEHIFAKEQSKRYLTSRI